MIDPVSSAHARSAALGGTRQPIAALDLPDALLRIEVVRVATGLSTATIYRKVAANEFPQPIKMGARCTRWKSGSVREWIAKQTETA